MLACKRSRVTALSLVLLVGMLSGGAKRAAPKASDQLDFGVQMARRGLWSEALFRFEQANRLEPGNPRVLNNLAVASEAVGRFEEAMAYYQEALKAAPGNKELKRNYARFIEFYQGFKPDQSAAEGAKAEGEGEGETDGGGSAQPLQP